MKFRSVQGAHTRAAGALDSCVHGERGSLGELVDQPMKRTLRSERTRVLRHTGKLAAINLRRLIISIFIQLLRELNLHKNSPSRSAHLINAESFCWWIAFLPNENSKNKH